MTTAELAPESGAVDLARECLYRFLSAMLADPYEGDWRRALGDGDESLVLEAAAILRDEAGASPGPLGFGELPLEALDVTPLVAALRQPTEWLRAEYDRVFGLVTPKECPPYETDYHPSAQTFQRSQELADISGFYLAFGIGPSGAAPERPDHIALELEFLAFLLLKRRLAARDAADDPEAEERVRVCEAAERSFFRDHLAWWAPVFATGLQSKARGGVYQALGRALAAFLAAERRRLGLAVPSRPAQPELIDQPDEQPGCAGCALRS